eukprot:6213722-Pleurochrysis_carterae.AAC.4
MVVAVMVVAVMVVAVMVGEEDAAPTCGARLGVAAAARRGARARAAPIRESLRATREEWREAGPL